MHFGDKSTRDDGTRPVTLRTAQKYMQFARDWSRLMAQHPESASSQNQVFKALAAIGRADEPKRIRGIGAARCANDGGGAGIGAARCANDKHRSRTRAVWRASGPFMREAFGLVSSVDETLPAR